MKKEYWQSEQGKALIKLGFWVIFIAIIYIIAITGSNTKTDNNNNNKPELNSNKEEIKYSNYSYVYNIVINEEKYNFEGKVTNEKEIGYKMQEDKIIKYEKENNVIYEVTLNERKEITNLYENLNSVFLDYNILITIINESQCVDNYCEFDYNNYVFKVTKNNNILTVNIVKENENYNLTYVKEN